ncbi:hypothetical protein NQ176_g10533 [Zarea fungicola]|uniref:Uncharacterized protein n=1 Tax=Zarea fungicola TaxID=93591 RepID=A0ACC1MFJ7_9HYPO|nr:hypothetical protein NQ176_g10533 [Lecanicillium fungicola]
MSPQTLIHATSIVDQLAVLGDGVEIGPFCQVGPRVHIGSGTRLLSGVTIVSDSVIGSGCIIYPNAVLGAEAPHQQQQQQQQLRRQQHTGRHIVIGNNCVIREGVTVHQPTNDAGVPTTVGDQCVLMANSHVAHDCVLGSNVILVNGVLLAGHVTIGNNTTVSGASGVAQRVHIGECAFISAGTFVNRDVLPFSMVMGMRARTRGVAVMRLRRLGWSAGKIQKLAHGLEMVFQGDAKGVEKLLGDEEVKNELGLVVALLKTSKNGICPPDTLAISGRVNRL